MPVHDLDPLQQQDLSVPVQRADDGRQHDAGGEAHERNVVDLQEEKVIDECAGDYSLSARWTRSEFRAVLRTCA